MQYTYIQCVCVYICVCTHTHTYIIHNLLQLNHIQKCLRNWACANFVLFVGCITAVGLFEIYQFPLFNSQANHKNFSFCNLSWGAAIWRYLECKWAISRSVLHLKRLCWPEFTVWALISTAMPSLFLRGQLFCHKSHWKPKAIINLGRDLDTLDTIEAVDFDFKIINSIASNFLENHIALYEFIRMSKKKPFSFSKVFQAYTYTP